MISHTKDQRSFSHKTQELPLTGHAIKHPGAICCTIQIPANCKSGCGADVTGNIIACPLISFGMASSNDIGNVGWKFMCR